MPDPIETTNIFDTIPDDYSGAVAVDPNPTPQPEAKPEPEVAVDPVEPTVEKTDDQPAKTPAQFAEERREAKRRKQELLESAEATAREKAELAAKYEEAQSKLSELQQTAEERDKESIVDTEEVEVLKQRLKTAEERYIAQNAPTVDPYQDDGVKSSLKGIEDALRANIPAKVMGLDGDKVRMNIDIARKEPARKSAMDQAVQAYATASKDGDNDTMEKAISLFGNALGNVDVEDSDLRDSIDNALAAASDPYLTAEARFREVQTNSVEIASKQRAEAVKQTESRLLAPLRLDPEKVNSVLEKDPANGWANFGKLFEGMPDDFKSAVSDSIKKDATVIAAMNFQPPPIRQGATSEEIQNHEKLVAASNERVSNAAQYLAVGRAMIDGGLLASLRAEAQSANERLNEVAGSTAIPRGGPGGEGGDTRTEAGPWASIPTNYSR